MPWSIAHCSGRCWPNGPPPASSFIPTGVVPGRAGSTWATLTRPCYATSRPGSRTVGSRRGECCDNAQAESLWSRLKTEELEARDWPVFADLADAQASVADYFDFYNHERRRSSIGYMKPYQFHQRELSNITQFSPA